MSETPIKTPIKTEVSTAGSGSVVEVFMAFLKLGLTSFGGPVAHLGYFHKELVEHRGWVSESHFSQLLALCQFLPGPASSQLGFALGLLRAGWLGAIAAFVAFTLPSALLLVFFAWLLPSIPEGNADAAIHGLKLLACAVVADAVWVMAKKLCPDWYRRGLALVATTVLVLIVSVWAQLLVVVAGAVAGMIFCRQTVSSMQPIIQLPYGRRFGLVLLVLFLLCLGLAFVPAEFGLVAIARTFYQAGAMVFGGGHVVLPLLESSVVVSGWVSAENFLAGYGAAQVIPGPMFAFAGYLGASIPTAHASGLGAGWPCCLCFYPAYY
ncbi:chromate efflux transporter [Oceanicoccus sp. KOV_DT_Chl]|uniref:chromate efflux transporter n=1 Tax=Oceanicoccus sp. KOV_DT_Chl TaxID=1904639 RepID=UPI001F3240C9|nr:chromate efflux transporter [Oceanicoccus sp. KOV_DT_Chl]